jgi:uncharacterized membrane protein
MTFVFVLSIGIGIVAGLRSLLAPAIVAWAAHIGWLNLHESPLAFMGSTPAVVIFTVIAIGELVGDKMPQTPRRTALPSLLARIVTGGLCGATLCAAAAESLWVGAVSGAIGSVIGAFAGYEIRRRLVCHLHGKDFFVAIFEDLVALGLGCFLVSR